MTEADAPARALVVDDVRSNRTIVGKCLEGMGIAVDEASDGREALDALRKSSYDAVLLDLEMPGMSGEEALGVIKSSDDLRDIPVLIISSHDEVERIARCLEAGADDYLTKPFNATVLRARVGACIERKRLRDSEKRTLAELESQREHAERLLLNVLPASIAARLQRGERSIVDRVDAATVIHAELANPRFEGGEAHAERAVAVLDELFSTFDELAANRAVERIKTFSDAWIAVGGAPEPRDDHAHAVADLALDMQRAAAKILGRLTRPMSVRIGVCSGPVVAGVIGATRFSYDVWGDPVRTATYLARQGIAGAVQVSANTQKLLTQSHLFEERGSFYVHGAGEVRTYLLTGSMS